MTRNELKNLWFSIPKQVNKKEMKVILLTSNKVKFDSMNCFEKYKSYTNSNAIPAICRNLTL